MIAQLIYNLVTCWVYVWVIQRTSPWVFPEVLSSLLCIHGEDDDTHEPWDVEAPNLETIPCGDVNNNKSVDKNGEVAELADHLSHQSTLSTGVWRPSVRINY